MARSIAMTERLSTLWQTLRRATRKQTPGNETNPPPPASSVSDATTDRADLNLSTDAPPALGIGN